MDDVLDVTAGEEFKIEDIADHLYKRVTEEIEKILVAQLEKLGVKGTDEVKKVIFPDDDKALAIYGFNGIKILGVRISDNAMGIEFETPNLNPATQKEREVQDV